MLPSPFWADLTTTDFGRVAMEDVTPVLPVAAVEQHGPHLPLGTDAMIMEGYIARVVAALPADLAVSFLPTQTVGHSPEHQAFSGTLTLSAEAAIAAWRGIGESVYRAGCRKLVIVSSHGGNSPVVDIVAQSLRANWGLTVVTVSWQRFGYPDGLFDPAEIRHGIHGGDIETSLMLAFHPDKVRMGEAMAFPSLTADMERDHIWLRHPRPAGFAWMAQDLNSAGVVGDAAAATAAKGEVAAAHGVAAFIALLREVRNFSL
ncbi:MULTISPECIES: creatininase family protein [unclassified Chelatococcus]|uniref:creatininase family protein n=1 Tax=unclassified Chelatococcus TaxID=2638111 RepID=UPI001BCEBDF5|nr:MULTISPECIES: creatininase family protein [unclassified Chelatococcus]CAH1663660.1 Creatinine amidohydrolase [Hyphomicrobiales bacterium]MBS7741604.1 creatininase family protein [Chelatococcus sp. HY11]MBX3544377.1 creatininase family protein [Chelatococcus sp.]MCO5079099.1 creatininase family protein [Chelatococcus sp.]CAH1682148.1 Creatinine amidohydrolase [Hyphomicrobiales bacterium]